MENIFVEFLPPWVETGLQPAFYDKESGTVLQQTARMYARVNMLIRLFNKLAKQTKDEIERFEDEVNTEVQRFEDEVDTRVTNFENSVNDTVADFIDQFNQLHQYVHDYFDNLDVQQEINNKLDALVQDGTIETILANYLPLGYMMTFDNVQDMKSATNFKNGCICICIGKTTYNDGDTTIFKVRTKVSGETADEVNIFALSTNTLVAEKIHSVDDLFGRTSDTCSVDSGWSYNIKSYYNLVKIPKALFDFTVIPYDDYGYDGAYKYVKNHPNAIYINGQLNSPTVINGVVTQENPGNNPEYWYFLGLDTNGEVKYTKDVDRTLKGSDLLADGYKEAIGIWSPIVIDGTAFNPAENLPTSESNYDYIINRKQPRAILGYDNDYWYILTIDARLSRSEGADFNGMVSLMNELNIPNAFNMDGGSSIQLWLSNPTTNLTVFDNSTYPRGYSSNNVVSLLKFKKKGE